MTPQEWRSWLETNCGSPEEWQLRMQTQHGFLRILGGPGLSPTADGVSTENLDSNELSKLFFGAKHAHWNEFRQVEQTCESWRQLLADIADAVHGIQSYNNKVARAVKADEKTAHGILGAFEQLFAILEDHLEFERRFELQVPVGRDGESPLWPLLGYLKDHPNVARDLRDAVSDGNKRDAYRPGPPSTGKTMRAALRSFLPVFYVFAFQVASRRPLTLVAFQEHETAKKNQDPLTPWADLSPHYQGRVREGFGVMLKNAADFFAMCCTAADVSLTRDTARDRHLPNAWVTAPPFPYDQI